MMIIEILSKLQRDLKAPKGQFNDFGKYKYRSCEDICEAVKTLLPDGVILTLTDKIVSVDGRWYVKAKATLTKDGSSLSVDAFAREPENKKGMDESQITGAASSYARKYALNGLLLIDDTKDADVTNKHEKSSKEHETQPKGKGSNKQKKPKDGQSDKPRAKNPDAPITDKQRDLLWKKMKFKKLEEDGSKTFYSAVLDLSSKKIPSIEWASDFIENFDNYFDIWTASKEISG